MKVRKMRDLTVIEDGEKIFVVSCDSAGGIGNKEQDRLKVDPYIVGKYTARVALMEVLSVGAEPIVLVNTLCVEMNPTGKRILEGIQEEARNVNVITGSTEENMVTVQTGIGITVIGECDVLRECKIRRGDFIVAVGIPKVGAEVLESEDIADVRDVEVLSKLEYVHDICPVGSKGIREEVRNMGSVRILESGLDLDKSCGPSTVVLVAIPEENLEDLRNAVRKPVTAVAEVI